MATDVSSTPVNGDYTLHQPYASMGQQQNNYAYNSNSTLQQPTAAQPPPASSTPAAPSSSQQGDIPKDEVGWYFVEQYYTTLSRNPEKLYLFYNKRSQFVSGQETDKVAVCVGQRAISDKIKELDFADCKVRVTNVDSQASDSNIVIQVIGEISNKSQPHKKFTQTFVLAAQTNGYFVLNDIFRYLVDEEDEPEMEGEPPIEETEQAAAAAEDSGFLEPVPTAADIEPKTLTSSIEPLAAEPDAKQIDKELEEKVLGESSKPVQAEETKVNGTPPSAPEVASVEDAPAAAVTQPDQTVAPELVQAPTEETKPEKPQEPEPTPAVTPPIDAAPRAAPAPKPSAPKSWAALAASGNRVATPVSPSTAAPVAPQARPSAPVARPAAPATSAATTTPTAPSIPAAPTAPAAQRDESPAAGSQGEEWATVGSSHNRQQSRQVNSQPQEPQNRAYIKNVHEGIGGDELKSTLEQYGKIVYFDVNRQKNSAFLEFETAEGYNAAVAANPHTIGGDQLYVERRRVGPQNAGYGRGNFQGGRGRGNFQGGRGNYVPRGARGGTVTPRGRGGSSQAV